jgi:uncharacterized protein YeaO (DUF488 family)
VHSRDYAARDYFDLWLPDLAPSAQLRGWALSEPLTDRRWARFVKAYRHEMQEPAARRLLQLLARFSHRVDFSVGCYCEHEDRCHRAILGALLAEHGARMKVGRRPARRRGPRRPRAGSRP